MKRIAITGSSGYLGSCWIRHLARREPEVEIFGIDIVEPAERDGYEFIKLDMCTPELPAVLESFRPDTLIHLAFIVPPIHDEAKMRAINVGGSRNVLKAASAVGVERLLVASSATVLGARPENPVPMDDAWPGRAGEGFRYAADKVELEAMLAEFADDHPNMLVSCVRPCIVGGPRMDNYLRRLLLEMPIIVLLDGVDSKVQLVHEEDVCEAMYAILTRGGTGVFNLAPADALSLTEIAELTGRPRMSAPFWLGRFLAWAAWKLHFPPHEYPPGFLDFVRYPWQVAANRLVKELGFRFRYSSRETFLATMKAAKEPPEIEE